MSRPPLDGSFGAPVTGSAAFDLDFKLLFERAAGLLLVLRPDQQFTILGASDAYLRATLTDRKNIVGRGLFDVFPDSQDQTAGRNAANLRASLSRVVAGKGSDTMPAQKYGMPGPKRGRNDFQERFWSTVNTPVLSPSGDLLYIVHRLEDATDLLRMAASRSEEADAAKKELESLSYSISHDLKAPLRAVDGFSSILEEDYGERLDDEGRRLLRVVRDNSQKMSRLIDAVLDLSRIGRKPLAVSDLDMTRLAEEALEELYVERDQRPQLTFGPLPPAPGDALLMKQVWTRLLDNAIKFSGVRERPLIEVSADEKDAENVYCVKDNGVGFSMQYYDRLFGVFQRLHSEQQFAGVGIGLAIVQRIVARHGGRVWAESKPQEGATFYFSLPKSA
jgi:signal transduction histidine kinase